MNYEFGQKKVTCKASEAVEYTAQGVCTGFLQLHKSRNGFRVLLPMDRLLLIFSLKQMALIRISLQNCFDKNNNNCRYHLLLSIIASFTLQTPSDSSQVFLFSSRRLWRSWLVLFCCENQWPPISRNLPVSGKLKKRVFRRFWFRDLGWWVLLAFAQIAVSCNPKSSVWQILGRESRQLLLIVVIREKETKRERVRECGWRQKVKWVGVC